MVFSTHIVKNIAEVATNLAVALDDVFVEPATEEVIKTRYNSLVFKSSFTYYTEDDRGHASVYDPFGIDLIELGSGGAGGVFCNELPLFHIPAATMAEILPDLEYHTQANPLLLHIVADYLKYRLNEEQSWAKLYRKPMEHVAQNYVDLSKLVTKRIPVLHGAFDSLRYEIHHAKQHFISELVTDQFGKESPYANCSVLVHISEQYAEQVYELRGLSTENKLVQDFYDRTEVQEALNDVSITIGKAIGAATRIESMVAEESLSVKAGYNVYNVFIKGENLVIQNMGDYRILAWELSK